MSEGNGDDPSQSGQFPSRLCPKCRGRDFVCDLCRGHDLESRRVSHFKAAAYLLDHPELHDTPPEFPSVHSPPDSDKGDPK